MGARLALEALLYHGASFKSLTCLSATLTVGNLKERKDLEQKWISDLSSLPLETFIKGWYKQKIFLGFSPPSRRFSQNKENLLKVLNDYSILKMPPLIEKLPACKTPISFIYKEKDPKARPLKGLAGISFIKAKTHAIHLENPRDCCLRRF